jgi:hypothetical protein
LGDRVEVGRICKVAAGQLLYYPRSVPFGVVIGVIEVELGMVASFKTWDAWGQVTVGHGEMEGAETVWLYQCRESLRHVPYLVHPDDIIQGGS